MGHRFEAVAEALGCRAQGKLGIDAQPARLVDGGEQSLADVVEGVVALMRVRSVRRALDQAGAGGAPLDLARVEQRRQVLGDLAEDAGLATGLAGLDLVPVAPHLAGRPRVHVAEDVRMAADELLAAMLGDGAEVAGAALL